ncbi:hypothetical protein EDC35_1121, partial [Thiobaca trueperi]
PNAELQQEPIERSHSEGYLRGAGLAGPGGDRRFSRLGGTPIPKDSELLRSAIWCSIAHYSFVAKHPKLTDATVFRGVIIFWIKLQYYFLDKRPNIDFEVLTRSVFSVIFTDGEAKVISGIVSGNADNHGNRFFLKVSAFMRVMINGPIKRSKIAFKNVCNDRLKFFVVQKMSPRTVGWDEQERIPTSCLRIVGVRKLTPTYTGYCWARPFSYNFFQSI